MDYLLNIILVIITIAFCAYVLKAKNQARKMSHQVRDSLKAEQERKNKVKANNSQS